MFRNHEPGNFVCALLLFSSLTLLAGSAQADPLRIGNILSRSGPALQVHVTSMRAMRYVDMVPQHTDFSCGAASLATILKYAYGRDVTEAEVVSGMFKVSDPAVVQREGFSLLDLKNYVETLGLRGRGYKVEAAVLDQIKIPVIVLLDIKGYKHFVVLKKVDGDRVYVGDPALGNRVMAREDFLESWNHIVFAVVGKGFIRDTVLINPPEPFTARRLAGHHTITHAQLIDFGFTRADLF
ncbi:MAG TPA: C39 family peptidase [Burkholderiales bacterium]|nr:C39 family peptidase [Burkholderiales bacterium]